jgi:hypothetical protein
MQKTLAFLEQNVQWLALAVAAIFFGLCVWWYVVTPPAVVTDMKLSKEPLTPQNVDDTIKAGPVQNLHRQLQNDGGVAIKVPDVVQPWQLAMNGVTASPLVMPWSRPLFDPRTSYGPTPFDPKGPVTAPCKDLPVLPKAVVQAPTAGLSVVSMPAPAQGGAQPVNANNSDQEWATVSATIPAKETQEAFDKIQKELDQQLAARNLPSIKLTTDILRVELQRQRGTMGPNGPVFPNGDQGVEVVPVVKYLQTDIKVFPDAKAPLVEKVTFYEWAEKNMELVCQPKFYDVHGGTPWVAPVLAGAAPAPGAAAVPAPAPGAAKGLAGIPPALPPRGAVVQPPPGGLNAPGANQNAGQINPANLTQDILVWNHDDTVQSGQVYRYRVVYYMKNPVLGLQGVADPSILEQLEVKSPPSDWTTPVTIPQVTKFWLTSLSSTSAAADLYHWENGEWKRRQRVQFQPGDRVADSEWTVVDVHSGNREREKYVILTNDNGEIVRRYPSVDRGNEEKKGLDAQVNPNPAPAGPGGNAAPPPPQPSRPNAASGRPAPRGGG